ncbi:MAG: quinone-dependent dihydroorotate dehydrogenase [candidate division WOR-3 bacterium]
MRKLLFSLDPEISHNLTIKGLSFIKPVLLEIFNGRRVERTRVWNIEFLGKLGLAAGLDKNCDIGSLWGAFGFGFVEVGTITPLPQRGNPRPRLFRLEREKALINRMGFNNVGVKVAKERLLKDPRVVPVGINIGKNGDTPNDRAYEDYIFVLRQLYDLGDYFVLNVSSPNTEGLRELQKGENLEVILGEIWRFRRGKPYKPVMVKLAPEISGEDLEAIAKICEKNDIDGVILTNTLKVENGGLSGKPLFEISNARISEWVKISNIPVIGVGGIFSLRDVEKKLSFGAVLTQVYTGFVYRGWEIFQP